MFDLVIKNAKILDGTGNPYYYSDIGIKDGKIEKIARLPMEGKETIDASGLYLTPGFIDAHGHMDQMLDREPLMRAKIEQGITSSVGGLCGGSEAPTIDGGREILFSEYMDRICSDLYGASMGLMVGGGNLRSCAMGYSSDKPSASQMETMKRLLRDAMEAGALGISFGLAYPPSSYSDALEMAELCKVVAEYDGIAAFHLRNEEDHFYEGVQEAIDIAKLSGVRLALSHHKVMKPRNWGKTCVTLGMIDRAAEEGLEIFADAHPYGTISAGLKAYIPAEYHTLGMEKLTEMAKDPEGKKQLIKWIDDGLASGKAHYDEYNKEKAYVLSSRTHPELCGMRVMDIAKMQSKSFAEALVDLLGDDGMTSGGMHVDIMDQVDINRVLNHPRVMLCTDAASLLPDQAANPRVLGSFPRYIGRMCIKGGLMPLERAVMKITSLPARCYGFKTKGLIREGMDADIVIFDAVTIMDNATVEKYDAPNSGLNYVIVNGKVAAKDGRNTGIRAGKIIRAR